MLNNGREPCAYHAIFFAVFLTVLLVGAIPLSPPSRADSGRCEGANDDFIKIWCSEDSGHYGGKGDGAEHSPGPSSSSPVHYRSEERRVGQERSTLCRPSAQKDTRRTA